MEYCVKNINSGMLSLVLKDREGFLEDSFEIQYNVNKYKKVPTYRKHKRLRITKVRCINVKQIGGNSCRSPIAEAVFDNEIKKQNLFHLWEVDSAALLQYHVGNDPEPRTMSVLKKRGITGYTHKAKQIKKEDFYKFDWIFGMDNGIVYDLCQMQPKDSNAKIELLGKYDPNRELNIRDPLFDNNSAGFEKAFEQATRSIKSFLQQHTNAAINQSG